MAFFTQKTTKLMVMTAHLASLCAPLQSSVQLCKDGCMQSVHCHPSGTMQMCVPDLSQLLLRMHLRLHLQLTDIFAATLQLSEWNAARVFLK